MCMARRRRPSIPLIILFVILLLLFLFAGTLADLVSGWTAQGTFTFSYSVGNDPIVFVTYTLPQDLADAIVPKQVDGWVVSLEDNLLCLTDGTLNVGESVTVGYRLTEYIESGERTITAVGTTASDTPTDPRTLALDVPELSLLAVMGMLSQNAIWFLVLAIIVLVVIVVLFILGEKKDKKQEADAEKSYGAVNFQQGAVETDSDWNEED